MKTLVVGGGPAGLAAAIALRLRGLQVTVIESRLPGIDRACGEGLLPEAVQHLHQLGVPAAESLGRPFFGVRFLDGQRSLAARFRHEVRGVGVRRTAPHSALVWRAERLGIDRWGTGARGLEGDAQWIIGVDGAASMVRRWAGLEGGREWSRRFAFLRHACVRGAIAWTCAGATDASSMSEALARTKFASPSSRGERCA